MKIAVASDHRGFAYKNILKDYLLSLGHVVIDKGPDNDASVDYPDFAKLVALTVASHECDSGVLVCGTGIGMAIAANKVSGVRAAVCHDAKTVEMSRRHNNANVLAFGADVVAENKIPGLLDAWVNHAFEGDRHQRRIDKIDRIEKIERSCGQ